MPACCEFNNLRSAVDPEPCERRDCSEMQRLILGLAAGALLAAFMSSDGLAQPGQMPSPAELRRAALSCPR